MATKTNINLHNARLMNLTNSVSKMYLRMDEIGKEAVEKIGLPLPVADKREDIYVEFPDNGAVKLPHPFRNGKEIGVKRIYLDEKYNLRISWYGQKKTERDIAILDHYGALQCVRLLDAILIHYGRE